MLWKAREGWLHLYLERRPERTTFERANLDPAPTPLAEEGQPGNHPEHDGNALNRLLRLHIAKLDEAWLSLENAERHLAGKSQASLWWARLRTLQFRVFAEHQFLDPAWPFHFARDQDTRDQDDPARRNGKGKFASGPQYPDPSHPCRRFRTLAFRRQHDHAHFIRETVKQGICANPGDLYRFVRLLDYFLPAHRYATNADELQRDPSVDFHKARGMHRAKVQKLLGDASKVWCPQLFKAFQLAARKGNLLSDYREYVDAGYAKDQCPIPKAVSKGT